MAPRGNPMVHFCGRRARGRGRLSQAERPARKQETGGGRFSQTSLATTGRASALFLANGAAEPAQPRRQALVWELQTPRGGPCAHYWLPLRAHCGGGATLGGLPPSQSFGRASGEEHAHLGAHSPEPRGARATGSSVRDLETCTCRRGAQPGAEPSPARKAPHHPPGSAAGSGAGAGACAEKDGSPAGVGGGRRRGSAPGVGPG